MPLHEAHSFRSCFRSSFPGFTLRNRVAHHDSAAPPTPTGLLPMLTGSAAAAEAADSYGFAAAAMGAHWTGPTAEPVPEKPLDTPAPSNPSAAV